MTNLIIMTIWMEQILKIQFEMDYWRRLYFILQEMYVADIC